MFSQLRLILLWFLLKVKLDIYNCRSKPIIYMMIMHGSIRKQNIQAVMYYHTSNQRICYDVIFISIQHAITKENRYDFYLTGRNYSQITRLPTLIISFMVLIVKIQLMCIYPSKLSLVTKENFCLNP